MVRRSTRLALITVVALVAAGPSALAAGGGTALAGPLNETVAGNATDGLGETTAALDGERTNESGKIDTVAEETGDATERTTEAGDTAADAGDATTEVADATDGTGATETATGEATDAADRVSGATEDATGAGDEPAGSAGDADDLAGDVTGDVRSVTAEALGARTTTASEAGEPSDERRARSEEASAATPAAESDGREETATGESAPGRSGDRSRGRGSDAVVGAGALTAAALAPHLRDGLALATEVGALPVSAALAGPPVGGLRSGPDRPRFVAPFGYSRYDDSDPLDHEVRARLYETVEASPGAYLSAVCDRADVAVSTARHHLDVLEDEGLVTSAKLRGKRRYFPARGDPVERELAAALDDDASAAVLRALARLGEVRGGRLADELGRDASTVSHHLSRLEDAGLVERERDGRAVVNRLAPQVRRALDDESETPAVAD